MGVVLQSRLHDTNEKALPQESFSLRNVTPVLRHVVEFVLVDLF
jgi:hypothetical protein